MKQDLRMNAKSPDPDDLAGEAMPQRDDTSQDSARGRERHSAEARADRSAPHIPPLEKGKITSNERS